MTKEFIHYEQALELKELKFEEPCFGHFDGGELNLYWADAEEIENLSIKQSGNALCKYECLAPTYSQAFRWFRKKYFLFGKPFLVIHLKKYSYQIDSDISYEHLNQIMYDTYEEAELACLNKLIEIVKEKLLWKKNL